AVSAQSRGRATPPHALGTSADEPERGQRPGDDRQEPVRHNDFAADRIRRSVPLEPETESGPLARAERGPRVARETFAMPMPLPPSVRRIRVAYKNLLVIDYRVQPVQLG